MPDWNQDIVIEASAARVWEIVGTRFGELATWAPAVQVSQMLTPDTRRCETAAGNIHELLLAFDDDARELTYEAVIRPAWMRRGINRWRVVPLSPDRCRVEVRATVQVHLGGLLRLLGQLPRMLAMSRTLEDLKIYAETGAPSARKVAAMTPARSSLRETRLGLGAWRRCVAVDVASSPEEIWSIVGDLGRISAYMPDLVHSELRGGVAPGVGAVRACRDRAGRAWAEQVTAYDPTERRFEVRFLHEEPGFPYPMRPMYGGWQVHARPGGARVEVWWSLTPTTPLPWLMVALLGLRVGPVMAAVIARMDAAARGVEPARAGTTWAAC